jgi:hypothetical protein
VGTIKDLTFAGTGSANFPTTPIAVFQTLSLGVSFALSSIGVTSQSASTIGLLGQGIFTMPGFDATPGTFVFTGNQQGGTLSFSASQASVPVSVPEPSSLLLSAGLLLCAGLTRRRFRAT